MIKLGDTKNVRIDNHQRKFGSLSYKTIKAIGDGNCAFNAFMLALLDAIKRDQYHLEDLNKQQALVAAVLKSRSILEERLALYRGEESMFKGGAAYSDLAPDLSKFIDLLQPGLSFQQLMQYLKQNTNNSLQVAVASVAFAPAFRKLGVRLYRKELAQIANDEESMHLDARALKEEGIAVGHEVLTSIAAEFGLNLKIYNSALPAANYFTRELADAPQIALVLEPGKTHAEDHWNFLLPANQQDGLASVLSVVEVNQQNIASVMTETESLINNEDAVVKQFQDNKATIEASLPEAAKGIKKASKNLLEINELNQPEHAASYNELLTRHSDNTKSILAALRDDLALSKTSLHNIRKVSALEEELLMGTSVPDLSDADARLAQSLQNAYVISFFGKHYADFARAKSEAASQQDASASNPNKAPN
jgi:hypothetical protein